MGNYLYDSHIHFNMKLLDPISDLTNYKISNNISKAVLILNTKQEFSKWCEAYTDSDFNNNFFPVFALNKNDFFLEEAILHLERLKNPLCIKLHPRLFLMKKQENNWYFSSIKKYKPRVIIVDDFLYGNSVEEGYAINLICKLAERFPDIYIVVAHSGGVNLLNHVMRCKIYKNVVFDISLTCNYLKHSSIMKDLVWLIKFENKRVMLGSDYPDFSIGEAIQSIKEICGKELSTDLVDKILWKNAGEVYGINE